MRLWLVLRTGRHRSCYECDGGGAADYWFVAAPDRREAIAIPRRFEELHLRRSYALDRDERLTEWMAAELGDAEDWKAVAIRPWRGKTPRIVSEREVER